MRDANLFNVRKQAMTESKGAYNTSISGSRCMESCEELSSISTLMLIGGAVLTLGVVCVVGVDVDSMLCVSVVVPSCVFSESSFSFCFL